MTEDLSLHMELTAHDAASSQIAAVRAALDELNKTVLNIGRSIKRSMGEDFAKAMGTAKAASVSLGTDATASMNRIATAIRADVQAMDSYTAAVRNAAAAQRGLAQGAAATQRAQRAGGRQANPARAAVADLRAVKQRWAIREKSIAAEAKAAADLTKQEAARSKAALDGVARQWRLRQNSERDHLRHLSTVKREQAAMRREMNRRVSEVYHQGRHSIRSLNHPAFESAGFWLSAGAAFGIEAGKHLIEAAKQLDTVTTRYSMQQGVTPADAAKVRAESLREGIRLGVDPAEVAKLRLQGLKDGLAPDVAKILPSSIQAAIQTMGGSLDKDGDELAKAVREASTVGWIKDAAGARSMMNQVAGLSTFNGNDPAKMRQFLASGGIGRGKELGWSQQQTLAFGAALNGSGERTGFGSARLMAQLPEIQAGIVDKYRRASRSHENSEERRAILSGPRKLGYAGPQEMQAAFRTPEGVVSFLSRLQRLDEKTRAQIEKGYGLGPQFNAVSAEMGANNGERYHHALKRENELSAQDPSNDVLSQNSKTWSKSIEFMLDQLKASTQAVQAELGDVIKDDILEPFTSWWVNISNALLDGGMKQDLHRAIQSFVQGLGFDDLTAALNSLRASVGTFDLSGFLLGVGQGLRTVTDSFASIAHALGFAGDGSARQLGKLAAEILGMSIALRIAAPVITLISGVASAFLAVKAAVSGVSLAAKFFNLSTGLKALLGIETATMATGLIGLAGALTTIGAAVQALLDLGILNRVTLLPKDTSKEGMDSWLWGKNKDGTSARPAWVDRLTGVAPSVASPTAPATPPVGLPDLPAMPMRYEGGDDPSNWRNLLQRASYEPSDSGDVVRQASVSTARGVVETRDAVLGLARVLRASALDGANSVRDGGSGGGGFGGVADRHANPSIRFGRQHSGSGGGEDTGGTASKMSGDTSARANRAMQRLMGLGWSKEAAAAAIGNAQQESGVRSDGPLGDTKRFGFGDDAAHGMFQWRGQRFRNLKAFAAARGKGWKDFDTQVDFFDQESKKYGSADWRSTKDIVHANRGMKRFEGYGDESFGQRLANARQLAAGRTDGGTYPAEGGTASGGGSGGSAVDKAMSMLGMGERASAQALGRRMSPGEWCADFVNGALNSAGIKGTNSSMARSFSQWGTRVGISGVQKGDVIEERHGDHVGHVGLATGKVQRDQNGNITAVQMVSGNYGHQIRTNWEKIGIIADLRRSNQQVKQAADKLKVKIDGDSKATSGAEMHQRIQKMKAPEGSTVNNTQADNSAVNHHYHIHGVSDPKEVAKHIQNMQDAQRRPRYTDTNAYV